MRVRGLGMALIATLASTAPAAGATLSFDNACQPGERIRIAAVGDLLFHDPLQKQSLVSGGRWQQLWSPVERALSSADIVYGNLEGPAAHGVGVGGGEVRDPGRVLDGRVYGRTEGVLIFNYHPSVLPALKAGGFTVVSTANNHAADRNALGIDRTIDNLRASGLAFTGTRKRNEPNASWSTLTRAKGATVAWLACTYSTNGLPDRHGQTLNCYGQRDVVFAELRRLAADPDIDAVIFTPHWGQEGAHQPLKSDREYARAAIDTGATAVLGAHPHVLQPWEKYRTADGRDGLIIYSLGNFISNQPQQAQRSGVIAMLELIRTAGRPAILTAVGFVPTWVEFTSVGHRVMELTGETSQKKKSLQHTLKLLPAGNRITLDRLHQFPRDCAPPPMASSGPPHDAALNLNISPPPARSSTARVAQALRVPMSARPPSHVRAVAAPQLRLPVQAASDATPQSFTPDLLPTARASNMPKSPPLPGQPGPEPRRWALRLEVLSERSV